MFNIYQLNIVRNERLNFREIITKDTFIKYLSTKEDHRIMVFITPILPLNISIIPPLLPTAAATSLRGATVSHLDYLDSLPTLFCLIYTVP